MRRCPSRRAGYSRSSACIWRTSAKCYFGRRHSTPKRTHRDKPRRRFDDRALAHSLFLLHHGCPHSLASARSDAGADPTRTPVRHLPCARTASSMRRSGLIHALAQPSQSSSRLSAIRSLAIRIALSAGKMGASRKRNDSATKRLPYPALVAFGRDSDTRCVAGQLPQRFRYSGECRDERIKRRTSAARARACFHVPNNFLTPECPLRRYTIVT